MQHWGQSIECLSSHYMFLFFLCCFLGLSLMCTPVYVCACAPVYVLVYTCCPPASVEKLHLPFYHFCLVSGYVAGLFRQREPSKHAVCCEPHTVWTEVRRPALQKRIDVERSGPPRSAICLGRADPPSAAQPGALPSTRAQRAREEPNAQRCSLG